MALITLAELLTVKPEADQLSPCALLTKRGLGALITGEEVGLQSRIGGTEMSKRWKDEIIEAKGPDGWKVKVCRLERKNGGGDQNVKGKMGKRFGQT